MKIIFFVWCEWLYMLNLRFYKISSYHWTFLSSHVLNFSSL